jgi:creatinine amidohydrolase
MISFHHWSDLPTTTFDLKSMESTLAVLPVSAIEQHGDHLPLATDAIIMEGYLARARTALKNKDVPPLTQLLLMPHECIGFSPEHLNFAGTLSEPIEALIARWQRLGDAVARVGICRLLIINSHGGNSSVVDTVARALRLKHGMLVVQTSWSRLGYPDGLFDAQEIRHGIHGGQIETALMLALRPDLMNVAAIQNFVPSSITWEKNYHVLRSDRPAGIAWLAEDLHSSGACGDASKATAEQGEQALAYGAEQFVHLVRDIALHPLPSSP